MAAGGLGRLPGAVNGVLAGSVIRSTALRSEMKKPQPLGVGPRPHLTFRTAVLYCFAVCAAVFFAQHFVLKAATPDSWGPFGRRRVRSRPGGTGRLLAFMGRIIAYSLWILQMWLRGEGRSASGNGLGMFDTTIFDRPMPPPMPSMTALVVMLPRPLSVATGVARRRYTLATCVW